MKKEHINDVQMSTVDEHLKLIMEDDSINNPVLDVTFNNLPHWYDKRLYKQAQNFYNRYYFAIHVAHFAGLIATFSITSILKVLLYTKQSTYPCAAFKRYVETYLHVQNIYTSDVNNTDSNWYKSINVIRWKHKTSGEKSKNAGVGPIYQRDMVFTQLSFVGYILMMPTYFGIRSEPIEDEAFNHFWRVIGYMLGIPDKLNLCRKTAVETRKLCQKIVETVFVNSLNEVSPDFDHIVSTVINSMRTVDMDLNKDILLILIYRIHGIEYKKPIKWYNKLFVKFYDLIFKLCLIPYIGTVIRVFFNNYFALKMFFMKKFPVFAWLKFGRENVRINLYPKYK